ncbi:MAG: PAS domain-containing protein [Alphaproteobacteria bacterium]|nr:PAS domain-containing protein [Alphaproteobacteria bacterium]
MAKRNFAILFSSIIAAIAIIACVVIGILNQSQVFAHETTASPSISMPSIGNMTNEGIIICLLIIIGALLSIITIWLLYIKKLSLQNYLLQKNEIMLAEILAVNPEGHLVWYYNATEGIPVHERCSRKLAVMLNLPDGTTSTFTDILKRFEKKHANVLEACTDNLIKNGESFTLELPIMDRDCVVSITGARATTNEGVILADVLWIKDITDKMDELTHLSNKLNQISDDRKHLQSILNLLPFPVWTRDKNLSITYCNPAYVHTSGAKSIEDTIKSSKELAHDSANRETRAIASLSRATRKAKTKDIHIVSNGERQLMSITETPFPTKGTEAPEYTAGVATNISKQEDAEKQINLQINAHHKLLENLTAAVAVFGSDTELQFCNLAFSRLWKLESYNKSSSITYSKYLDYSREFRLLPEVPDFPAFKKEELKYFTTLIETREDLLHLPNGKAIRRLLSPYPLGGLIATYEDVTDKLALERSYNTLVAVQKETLDNLHEAVAVFGNDGRLKLYNPAYMNMWSLDYDELNKSPLLDDIIKHLHTFFKSIENWDEVRKLIYEILSARSNKVARMERDDNKVIEISGVSLPDGGILMSCVDVTGAAKEERNLKDHSNTLAGATGLRSMFIDTFAYELQESLVGNVNMSENIKTYGKLNAEQKHSLETLTTNSNHLLNMAAEILDLTSIDVERPALEIDTIEVQQLMSNLSSLMHEKAKRKLQTINLTCPENIGWIVADSRRLKQILFYFFNTAVINAPEESNITFAAERVAFPIESSPNAKQKNAAKTNRKKSTKKPKKSGTNAENSSWIIFNIEYKGINAIKINDNPTLQFITKHSQMHGGTVEISSFDEKNTNIQISIPA